jgi:hypothetical protein
MLAGTFLTEVRCSVILYCSYCYEFGPIPDCAQEKFIQGNVIKTGDGCGDCLCVTFSYTNIATS